MDIRITREAMLIEMAFIAAKRGTCQRLSVGAIIARDSRPISLGYVGAPSGEPHCNPIDCADLSQPCMRTIHAETNAIAFADRYLINILDADMFVTDSPCLKCAHRIIGAQIKRVFFNRRYRKPEGILLLESLGVIVQQVERAA